MGVDMGETPTRVPGRRRLPRWAMGALVLPVAVLASVATSRSEDPTVRIVVVGDGWVATAEECDPMECSSSARAALVDGVWTPVDLVQADPNQQLVVQTEDCFTTEPMVCFRSSPTAVGVERSDDGGRTWSLDWELTSADLDSLREHYYTQGPPAAPLGVGVAPGDGGEEVWAAMGADGLAVRHPSGAWERVGFQPLFASADPPPAIPSETLAHPGDSLRLALGGGLLGTVVFLPHLVLLGALLPVLRDARERARAVAFAALSLLTAPLFVGLLLDYEFAEGEWPRYTIVSPFAWLMWLVGVGALRGLAVAGNIAGPNARRAGWMTLGVGAPTDIMGGALAWHLGASPLTGAFLGCVVAAVAWGAYAWRVAKRRPHPTEPADHPEANDA